MIFIHTLFITYHKRVSSTNGVQQQVNKTIIGQSGVGHRNLFFRGNVVSDDSNNSFTRVLLDTVRRTRSFLINGKQRVDENHILAQPM